MTTDFAGRVREVVAAIPPGDVLTYGEVATEAGAPGAARAVGNVLADGGDDLPWWRVVPASGRLAGHLAERQAAHLRRDGVSLRGTRVVAAEAGD